MSDLVLFFVISTVIFISAKCENFGTVLYVEDDLKHTCWSPTRTQTLYTRMIVEDLLPSPSIFNLIDDETLCNFHEYIRMVYKTINKETHGTRRQIMILAFTDAFGGYMRHLVMPNVKYAFYSGKIEYESVQKIQELYENAKSILNTNGAGWAEPVNKLTFKFEPHSFTSTISPDSKSCDLLTLYYSPRMENLDKNVPDIAVPLPYFDRLIKPTVLAVPLKSYPLRALTNPWGLDVVVKYYLNGYKCLSHKCKTKGNLLRSFENGVYTWILEEVMPVLCDEEIYTVFGGVLRVLSTLKHTGAKRVDLHVLREQYSHMLDEYVSPRKSVWTYTKHKKIAFAVIVLLFVWFTIGFCFVYVKVRSRIEKSSAAKEEKNEQCKCEGGVLGAVRSVTDGVKKTLSKIKSVHKQIKKSKTKFKASKSSPRKNDCTCFAVEQVYNIEESDEESFVEEENTQRKSLDEIGSGSIRTGRVCAPSYSFAYDFQTSTSESETDSDSDLDLNRT